MWGVVPFLQGSQSQLRHHGSVVVLYFFSCMALVASQLDPGTARVTNKPVMERRWLLCETCSGLSDTDLATTCQVIKQTCDQSCTCSIKLGVPAFVLLPAP